MVPLFLLLPLAACGTESRRATEPHAGNENVTAVPPVQTDDPVGLFEDRRDPVASQLCVVGDGPEYRFGLILRSATGACGGAGTLTRNGARIRLEMAGDRDCALDARMEGQRLILPAAVGAGCAYYCAPGATLANARFEKTGGTEQAALRARDPVGDPLCEVSD